MNLHPPAAKKRRTLEDSLMKLLGDILGSINQGAMILDSDLHLIFANGQIQDMLSISKLGEIEEIFLRNCPKSVLAKSADEGSTVTYLDLMLPGGKRDLLVGINAYRLNLYHESCYYIVMVNDFSRWRKLDEVQARFATSISHRLRTPLTATKNAIRILSDKENIAPGDRKKLLDIGWRNIEKLVSLFEELQKVFMIDSEEISINRSLYKVDELVTSSLNRLKEEGKIADFSFNGEDCSLITVKGAVEKFIRGTVEVYESLLNSCPSIRCSVCVDNGDHSDDQNNRILKVRVKPVCENSSAELEGKLKDSLNYSEAHRRLFLDKVAASIDGEVEIYCDNSIVLSLPMAPVFDREKDLISPLQVMMERGELGGVTLHMIKVQIVGMVDDPVYYRTVLQELMIDILPAGKYLVSQGMKPLSWYLFVMGMDSHRIEQVLSEMIQSFQARCRDSGREMFPGIRWEIKYHRDFSSEKRSDVHISDIEQFCH